MAQKGGKHYLPFLCGLIYNMLEDEVLMNPFNTKVAFGDHKTQTRLLKEL